MREADVHSGEKAEVRWVHDVIIGSSGPEGGNDDELSSYFRSLMRVGGNGRGEWGGLSGSGEGFSTAALGSMLFRAYRGGMKCAGREAVREEAFSGFT